MKWRKEREQKNRMRKEKGIRNSTTFSRFFESRGKHLKKVAWKSPSHGIFERPIDLESVSDAKNWKVSSVRIERRRYATGNIRTRASKYTFVALSIAEKSRGNTNWLSFGNFRRTEAKLSQTFHSRLGICLELSLLVFRPETVCLYLLPIKF